ncbi:MAG TPA: IS1634 family transposase [Candidatus Cloacimonadota bacterium]|jgi:transposase|nr:IS1634 family transposase [Candidatus Cloacimonadota bacterium]
MFIKKVVKTYKSTGKTYTEYRFVRGYRTSVGPRHQTVLTVRDIPLPEAQWKLLADTVEALLKDEDILFVDEVVLALATHYCNLIRTRHPETNDQGSGGSVPRDPDELVYRGSLKLFNDRSIGAEYIGYAMYKRLGFDDLFKSLEISPRHRKLIGLSIIGRLSAPGSENATRRWARELSGIGELMEEDFSQLGHNSLYRISDVIYSHKDKIESYLCEREQSIFNLQESLCLYDLTNTFLEGKAEGIPKAKFGRSKEKRTDCRLLTLGMVVDEQGFCKRSKIMEGSVSEPKTLKEMIDYLSETSFGRHRPTVVMDAGIATQANLQYLRENELHYLCVSRTRPLSLDQIDKSKMITVYKDKTNLVEAQLIPADNEVILYCHSQKMEMKERAMHDSYRNRFEEDLDKIRTSLTKRYSDKSVGAIRQRIGRLKERYTSINRFYHIEVREIDGIVSAIDCHKIKSAEEEERFSGNYWLRSSLTDWDEHHIWNTYMMLNRIEAAFRSLKHELAFRPVYHSKGHRTDAHIFIAVLAYHLLNAICHELSEHGIHDSWKTVREMMSTHRVVSITGISPSKNHFSDRITTAPEHYHISIYKALNLSPNPTLKRVAKGEM